MLRRSLLLIAFSTSCATQPTPPLIDLNDLNSPDRKIAAIDSLARHALAFSQLENMPVAGLSLSVYLNGEPLLVKGYGFADLEKKTPVSPDHIFRIGSVTKHFTAAAIMVLIEDGKVRLDDTVATYLPEYPELGSGITLRQLLNHTSGLNNFTDLPDWTELENNPMSRPELVKVMLAQPMKFRPGEGNAYSNSGYYLLGLVIEKVSGMSYGDFVQKRLIAKTGLKSIRYCPPEQNYPEAAKGYAMDQGRNKPANPLNMEHPFAAGALCSTADDLARWTLALAQGKVIRPDSYQQMITPGKASPGYGFGLTVYNEYGHRYVGHGGGINGFSDTLDFFPDDHLIVVVQANTESLAPTELAVTLAHMLMGRIRDRPIAEAEARPLLGKYQFPTLELTCRLSWENGQLVTRFLDEKGESGPAMRLLSQGEGSYWINEKALEVRFEKNRVLVRLTGKDFEGSKLP